MVKNKKGWIMLIEVFVGILLITAILVVSLNNPYLSKGDIYEKFYSIESGILEEIQLDNSLRAIVLATPVPKNWSDADFPIQIKNKINSKKPNYLNCSANICRLNDICDMENLPKRDVYVEAVAITSTLESYNPKKIKLFCWENY
jgi:uncharacterized protein (UPF0147 family)